LAGDNVGIKAHAPPGAWASGIFGVADTLAGMWRTLVAAAVALTGMLAQARLALADIPPDPMDDGCCATTTGDPHAAALAVAIAGLGLVWVLRRRK